MKPSTASADPPGLETQRSFVDCGAGAGAGALEIIACIREARDAQEVVQLFRQALRLAGADVGVFLSVIDDDALHTSFRWLLACDPIWAIDYAEGIWHESDPWLRHALTSGEPIRGADLLLRPAEHSFVAAAARHGFASTVVAPAPSCAGASRIGMLCLGSNDPRFFDGDEARLALVLARSLAMELHDWMHRALKLELLTQSRITADEVELLRREQAGQTSKVIAASLNIEAKTVDSRFQKLSAKLNAPDRRTAARIARLYGLL